MEDFMLGFILAMISGALMSIQGVFNTNLTKHTSIWLATGWVHFSAFGVCILAWLFYGRNISIDRYYDAPDGNLRDLLLCFYKREAASLL